MDTNCLSLGPLGEPTEPLGEPTEPLGDLDSSTVAIATSSENISLEDVRDQLRQLLEVCLLLSVCALLAVLLFCPT